MCAPETTREGPFLARSTLACSRRAVRRASPPPGIGSPARDGRRCFPLSCGAASNRRFRLGCAFQPVRTRGAVSPCSGRAPPPFGRTGRQPLPPPALPDARCTPTCFCPLCPRCIPRCASLPLPVLPGAASDRGAAAHPHHLSFSRPGRTPTRASQFRSHCSRVKSCSRSGWHTDRRRAAQRRPQPAVRYGSSDDAPGPFSVRAGSSLRIGRSLASPPPVSPPGGPGPAASARPLLFRSGRTAAAPEPPRRVSPGACTPRTDPYVQRNCR